jgi:hypothetical protein
MINELTKFRKEKTLNKYFFDIYILEEKYINLTKND